MALALTIGIGGAFATQSSHQKSFKAPGDLYQDSDAAGNIILTEDGGQTYANQAAATLATGCTTGSDFCAVSVNHADGSKTGTSIKRN